MILKQRTYKPYSSKEISLRRDEIFRIVLGTNYRSEYLKDFLEGILHKTIINIIIKNDVPLDKLHQDNKLMRLDILVDVVDENGKKEKINVEMQNRNEYNIKERSYAYAGGIVYNSLHVKEDYIEIPRTVVIWILGFNLFEDGDYHEIARVKRDYNNEELSEKIEYHYIQLPKFLEQVTEIKSKEEQWLAYISNSLNKKELEELFKMNRSIEEINKIVDIVMTDSDVMDALNDRILAQNLENLKMARAREQGIEKGIEKGIEQGMEQGEKSEKIKIAKKLLENNSSIEYVMEITGLTEEEVKQLV